MRQSPHRLGEEAQSTVAETTPQLTTRLRAGFFFALSGVTSLRSDRRNSVILWGLSILPLLNLVPIPCSNASALPVLDSETNNNNFGPEPIPKLARRTSRSATDRPKLTGRKAKIK